MSRFRTGPGAGVDLDDVFDLYVQGDKVAPTGFTNDGVDLRERYAPLQSGSQAALTGFRIATGADFNTLWAAKGTAVYRLPFHGTNFIVADQAKTNQGQVQASIGFTLAANGTYRVFSGTLQSGSSDLATGTWNTFGEPAGAFEVLIEMALTAGQPSSTVINDAAAWASLGSNRGCSIALGPFGASNAELRETEQTVRVRIRRAATSAVLSDTTFAMTAQTLGFA